MSLQAHMRSLDAVAARLPFGVSDYDAANEAFARWRATGDAADRETVELWVYCYAQRYFVVKYLRDPDLDPAGMEAPIGEAYRRAIAGLERVEQPERFAAYVSVTCKHTFVNATRRAARTRERFTTVGDDVEVADAGEDPLAGYDAELLRHALGAAMARLPDAIRDVARRRLLDGESYDALEAETGHPRATLRSYVNKALRRMSADPLLRDVFREWVE